MNPTQSPCLDDWTLSALQLGDLSPREASQAHDHLSQCPSCREKLMSFVNLSQTCAAAPIPTLSPSQRNALQDRIFNTLKIGSQPATKPLQPPTQPPTQFLTLEEAAACLRITYEQLQDVLDTLPTFEIAGVVRIRRTALEAWARERESVRPPTLRLVRSDLV